MQGSVYLASMLKYIDKWSYINSSSPSMLPSVSCNISASFSCTSPCISSFNQSNSKPINKFRASHTITCARRRIRYDEDDYERDGEEYGHNEDIAMLEYYSQSAKEVALLVKAVVDQQDVEILIFKGFSSSLSHGTIPDLSRSIIPARGEIKSIDIVKGPFNPSNIEYIDKGLSWDTFKTQFL